MCYGDGEIRKNGQLIAAYDDPDAGVALALFHRRVEIENGSFYRPVSFFTRQTGNPQHDPEEI